jgi:hypothetical protein
MSFTFSNTTDRTGIVELLEDLTGTASATTSSYPLKTKTRDINNAYADYFMIAMKSAGTWQVDDTNQTDYPIITTNLVTTQQDYSFTLDGSTPANQILDIYRVEMKDASGNWTLLEPYDEMSETSALSAQATSSGTPFRYHKTANGIFLDVTPNYNSTNGLKIYCARTPVYFVSTDTTKQPGIPHMFYRYLALKPAYFYCLQKGKEQANAYGVEVEKIEQAIKKYHGDRKRDEQVVLTSETINPY